MTIAITWDFSHILPGTPNRYAGQRYRILVDLRHFDGRVEATRMGWANEIDEDWLRRSSNGDTNWSNLRYEEVTDPTAEGPAP